MPWRIVVSGALLQIVLAAALLKLPLFRDVFLGLNELLSALERAAQEGTRFVLGFLGGGIAGGLIFLSLSVIYFTLFIEQLMLS